MKENDRIKNISAWVAVTMLSVTIARCITHKTALNCLEIHFFRTRKFHIFEVVVFKHGGEEHNFSTSAINSFHLIVLIAVVFPHVLP